jgi:hypothetical protein
VTCEGVDGQSEVLLGLTKLPFGDEQSESSHERMKRTALGPPDRGKCLCPQPRVASAHNWAKLLVTVVIVIAGIG